MYLVTQATSEAQAKAFSALFWSLCTTADAQTQYGPTWCQHPTSGAWALNLGDAQWYVHPQADLERFLAALPIPDEERDTLRSDLHAARGGHVEASSLVPPTMQAGLLTREEMDAAGWFEAVP